MLGTRVGVVLAATFVITACVKQPNAKIIPAGDNWFCWRASQNGRATMSSCYRSQAECDRGKAGNQEAAQKQGRSGNWEECAPQKRAACITVREKLQNIEFPVC